MNYTDNIKTQIEDLVCSAIDNVWRDIDVLDYITKDDIEYSVAIAMEDNINDTINKIIEDVINSLI